MPSITDPQWQAIRREARRTAHAVITEQLPLFQTLTLEKAARQATVIAATEVSRVVGPIVPENRKNVPYFHPSWFKGGWEPTKEDKKKVVDWEYEDRGANLNHAVPFYSEAGNRITGRTHSQNMRAMNYLLSNPDQCLFASHGTFYVGPRDLEARTSPSPPTKFADNYTGPIQFTVERPYQVPERRTAPYTELRRLLHKNPDKCAVSVNGTLHIRPLPIPSPKNETVRFFEAFGELPPDLHRAIDKEVEKRLAVRLEQVRNNLR